MLGLIKERIAGSTNVVTGMVMMNTICLDIAPKMLKMMRTMKMVMMKTLGSLRSLRRPVQFMSSPLNPGIRQMMDSAQEEQRSVIARSSLRVQVQQCYL